MDEEERLCKARAKAKVIREQKYARERRLLQEEIDRSTPLVGRSTEMPVVDQPNKTQVVDKPDEDEVTVTITIKRKGNGDFLKLVNLSGLVNP